MKLKLQNISMSFSDKKILSQITMNIEEGEFVTILGPSGCGKSTILNILSGILHQDEGTVFVDDKEIKDPGEHFAYMPQEDLLLPWKNCRSTAELPRRAHHPRHCPAQMFHR